uniref:DUF6824 domain-containing protein n=1 Tax=Trieres chinensis TaxID=1514140 RepID=A0A7S1Z609_TRICV|mmetsp:Transcript_18533/g.37564  ORF Transcript_18533/g.37564 Transcript_18533/m.37564 type:complete len:401 (+) Transcript_18533:89-1291(+)
MAASDKNEPTCLANDNEESHAGIILSLNPNDVLCGRGSGPNDHAGNISFRRLILSRKAEYLSTNTRSIKARIAKEIIDHVHELDPPGRFLKKIERETSNHSGSKEAWSVVSEDVALEKAKQALRQNRDRHLVEADIIRFQQAHMQVPGKYDDGNPRSRTGSDGSEETVLASGSSDRPVHSHTQTRDVATSSPDRRVQQRVKPDSHISSSAAYFDHDNDAGTSRMGPPPPQECYGAEQNNWIKQEATTATDIERNFQQIRRDIQKQRFQEQFPFAFGSPGSKESMDDFASDESPVQNTHRRRGFSGRTSEYVRSVFEKGQPLTGDQHQRQRLYQEQDGNNSFRRNPSYKSFTITERGQSNRNMSTATMTLTGMSELSMSMSMSVSDLALPKDISMKCLFTE